MTDTVPTVAVVPPLGGSAAPGVGAWAVVVLFALGIVLAALGVLVVPVRLHIAGRALPIAWAAALVNFTAGRLAQGALERWWAPLVPFLGWAMVVGPMTVFTPGGDKIFAYDDPSLLYVVLGVLAFMGTVGTAATPARQTSR